MKAHIPYFSACHLQSDADPEPDRHFDAGGFYLSIWRGSGSATLVSRYWDIPVCFWSPLVHLEWIRINCGCGSETMISTFYLKCFIFLLIEFIWVSYFSIFEILLKICLKPMVSLNVGVTWAALLLRTSFIKSLFEIQSELRKGLNQYLCLELDIGYILQFLGTKIFWFNWRKRRNGVLVRYYVSVKTTCCLEHWAK